MMGSMVVDVWELMVNGCKDDSRWLVRMVDDGQWWLGMVVGMMVSHCC